MKYTGSAALAVCLGALSSQAFAADIPQVLLTNSSQPAKCVTPGRLMAFVKHRNPTLRPRFENIATLYMKHGETLKIRWDFAFFQMMLETNTLKYTGDVDWDQNNFAGLGATGGGVKGERFSSVSDGVRAHLEHLLIYAGVYVNNPIAERTRKVQAWKILDKWRRTIRGPMTFKHIGRKWAPGARNYALNIKTLADLFFRTHCNITDPRPDLIAAARQGSTISAQPPAAKTNRSAAASALQNRASLGAATVYRRKQPAAPKTVPSNRSATTQRQPNTSNIQILNKSAKPQAPAKRASTNTAASKAKPLANKRVASAAGKFASTWVNPATRQSQNQQASVTAPSTAGAAKVAPKKCRVWTASYGGQKAIIIKSADKSHVNYTVLDVNPGREAQEAAAYIAAYAQGGQKIAEFRSQTLALDKAFKLCPDG